MQALSFSIVLFYYGLLTFIVIAVVIGGESMIKRDKLRILNYTSEQYKACIVPVITNFFQLSAKTIAWQNEKSGVIGLFGYSSIAYCIYADMLVFNEQLQNLEIAGITVILLMNVTLIA